MPCANERGRTIWQFVIVKHKWTSVFHVSVLLSTMNFVIHSYFDNVMTKFMINNRTDAWETDVNLLNRPIEPEYNLTYFEPKRTIGAPGSNPCRALGAALGIWRVRKGRVHELGCRGFWAERSPELAFYSVLVYVDVIVKLLIKSARLQFYDHSWEWKWFMER